MDPELQAARQEYEAAFGKKPHHKWDETRLREKIVEGPPPPAPEAPEPEAPPPERPAETVKVMVLCDHVYLPRDPSDGGWASSQDTVRVEGKAEDGRRTRVECHPTLAKFLQGRSQVEILD